jgi:hypothetical protein
MAVKLFRYIHNLTGEEVGISYSDDKGLPMNIPDVHAEEIPEYQKTAYITKQREQEAKKSRDMAVAATDQTKLGQLTSRVDAQERAIKMLVRKIEALQKTGGK